ncbi:MAG: LLM class F420-dependent oxidoreductase [Candidatus Limnocylindrales bacterium]|jgi:F420-dependent oxidoreductase-like protein
MKIGLQVPSFTWPGGDAAIGPTLGRIAEAGDAAGLDSLWVMDHFYQIRGVGRPEEPMLEGWTALGFMAAHSKTATLGLMVGGVHYREAGLWAKAATTLDVLSGGRAYLGIGAAWNEEESHGLGFPMPPLGVRFEMLEETLQIVHAMWQGPRGSEERFEGKHYHAGRLLNSPQALTKPHPRIIIGGGGEQKTLRLVAKYADACNIFGGPDQLAHKFSVLRERCTEVGRPFEEIERTNLAHVDLAAQTPAEIIAAFRRLAQVGVQHVIFNLTNVHDLRNLETLGRDVIPQVHSIETAAI